MSIYLYSSIAKVISDFQANDDSDMQTSDELNFISKYIANSISKIEGIEKKLTENILALQKVLAHALQM